jgi:hypothetical protein
MPKEETPSRRVGSKPFSYYMTFGTYDQIITDPGSDIMGKAVTQLNAWLGLEHLVSVVGRHESNGVEGTNKQIIRHLRWSATKHKLAFVFYLLLKKRYNCSFSNKKSNWSCVCFVLKNSSK